MADIYLNTNDIIEWINEWTINNPDPSEADVEQFARDLSDRMQRINYKVSGEATVIGYAGKVKDNGTGIFETVKNLTENSDGKYIFINNSADNILNNTAFQKALRSAVDEYYDSIMNGKWNGDIRSKNCFDGVLSLNDLVSDNFMKNNAKGDIYLLITENARMDSTLNVTEIERLLAMDEVKTINGVEKSVLARMSSVDRFNFLKEQSVIDLMNAKVYIDSTGKELLSFEGTKFEDIFHVDINSNYVEIGRYAERVFASDTELYTKYPFLEGFTDAEALDATRIFDYLVSKGKNVSEISLGEVGKAKLPFLSGDLSVYESLGVDTSIEGFLKSFGTNSEEMSAVSEIIRKVPEGTLQEYLSLLQVKGLVEQSSLLAELPESAGSSSFFKSFYEELAKYADTFDSLSPEIKNNTKLWNKLIDKYVNIPLEDGNSVLNPKGLENVFGDAVKASRRLEKVNKAFDALGKVGKVLGPIVVIADFALTLKNVSDEYNETGDAEAAVKEVTGWALGMACGFEGSAIAMEAVAPLCAYLVPLAPPWGAIGAGVIELAAGIVGFIGGEKVGDKLNDWSWAIGDYINDNFVEGHFAENWLLGWESIKDYVGDKWNAWNVYWENVGGRIFDKVEEFKDYLGDLGDSAYSAIRGWLNDFIDMDDILVESMQIWSDFLDNSSEELISLIDSGYYNVIIGTDGIDLLDGESGSDLILGGAGDDQLCGLDGNDLIYGGSGNDLILGNEGDDELYGEEGDDELQGGSGDDILYGESGNDVLWGESGDDVAFGGDGDDFLSGEDDNDELHGDNGNDSLYGDNGNDKLFGGYGNDVLYGGDGNDELFGDEGNDTLYGDIGDDYLEGGNGNNTMYGGEGDDVFVGGEDTDYMYGENGNDVFHGGNGSNYMYGGDGDDNFTGGEGYDYIEGGNGTDTMNGGNGYNEMYGQEGDDFIYGGNDNDYIDGGVGNDNLYGGNGNNTIHGREGDDIIYDGDDASYIYGEEGDDTIRAGGGNDVIDGGTGNDFIQDDHGDDTIIFNAGYGVDTIWDAAGYNTIQLSGLDVTSASYSRSGNDLTVSFGGDAIILKQYYDFYNFNINGTDVSALIHSLHGSDNADWMNISNTNGDSLYGEGGNDSLSGNSGNDYLYGGSGDDYIYGNDGDDLLDGGTGNDQLNGGNGEDTYIFAKGYAQDTINEWGSDHSYVVLADISSDEITVSNQWGSNLLISVNGTDDVLTISNFKWGQSTFTLKFADGAEGYVDKNTWQLVLTKQPDEIEDTEQMGAELLESLYEDDELMTSIFTDDSTDSTVITDVTESTALTDESDDISDMTDIQAMLLAENMSAFGNDDQISESMNITDITADTSLTDSLLIDPMN